jgi:hypothetical protein
LLKKKGAMLLVSAAPPPPKKKEVLGRTNLFTFPYRSHLLEILEPNLMERTLSELTLTSFNSV